MVYLKLEVINLFRSIQWFLRGLMTVNLSFQSFDNQRIRINYF